ncbi:helix-turn-helix transcriptional regulator [Marinifilum sp. RC60d5]|uniref:helix-turn-helix transcriptional regulator n=1 Tax=Marinifilum sp. RC60d5 TaxID=3458414 RepID=UPI004035AC5D
MNFKIQNDAFKGGVLIFLLLNMIGIGTLQSHAVVNQIKSDQLPEEVMVDSSVFRLNMAYENGIVEQDTFSIIRSLLSLIKIKKEQLDFSDAFDHSGEALFLAEELGDSILLAKAYDNFGMLNYIFNQEEETRKYIEKSLVLNRELYHDKQISSSEMISSYYHKMLLDLRYKKLGSAREYLDSCYMISDTINQTPLARAMLDSKKATFLYRNNQFDKATNLMLSIIDILENNKENTVENKKFLVSVYSKISEEYRKENKIELALLYLNKATKTQKIYGKNTIQKAYLLERLSLLQANKGEFEKAYKNIRKSKNINETFFSAKRKRNSGFLQVKNRYQEELLNKDIELNRINLELAEKVKAFLIFRIIIIALVLILIILGLVVRNKKQQKKYQKDQQVNLQKQKESKELLEIKNKELTASTLKLIEKEEIIKTLVDQMNASKEQVMTDALMTSINKSSNSLWDDFNNRFMSVNEDFYERLRLAVPDLSPTDLKVCALIKLNFTGKEMAHLLGISVNSVHMARHRLRKKMDLERNTNLSNFIASI